MRVPLHINWLWSLTY